MTNEELHAQIRNDIQELVNKQVETAMTNGIASEMLVSLLVANMIDAAVVALKSIGVDKATAKMSIKDVLNESFNDNWK